MSRIHKKGSENVFDILGTDLRAPDYKNKNGSMCRYKGCIKEQDTYTFNYIIYVILTPSSVNPLKDQKKKNIEIVKRLKFPQVYVKQKKNFHSFCRNFKKYNNWINCSS